MIKDLAITTWSHSSYSDIWPMYYGQFEINAPFFKHYMFINKHTQKIPKYCSEIINNENNKFSQRLCYSLDKVSEKNIIWMQEDFVFYDKVKKTEIEEINNFLNESDYSFVRLMKSGVEGGKSINKNLSIYEIPYNCNYFYCLQAAIWKKKDLHHLFKTYRPKNMMDAELYGSQTMRGLGMKGCYVYKGEDKRGNLHYDSSVYPYISTALHGGSHGKPAKWQTSLYKKELSELFLKYEIDPNKRGEC